MVFGVGNLKISFTLNKNTWCRNKNVNNHIWMFASDRRTTKRYNHIQTSKNLDKIIYNEAKKQYTTAYLKLLKSMY